MTPDSGGNHKINFMYKSKMVTFRGLDFRYNFYNAHLNRVIQKICGYTMLQIVIKKKVNYSLVDLIL